MARLRTAIESQLTDPAANRASIAAAAGLSERHANRLLVHEGTSIAELLRKRRLAKCRETLEQSNRQINDASLAGHSQATLPATSSRNSVSRRVRCAYLSAKNRHDGT